MTYRASRLITTASAAYAVFALAKPEHLGKAMKAETGQLAGYRGLAYAYGVGDLTISSVGLVGRSRVAIRLAMGLRVASDLSDCVVLLVHADEPAVKRKVAAVTLGYAALNAAALVYDERRAA